jgi:hypothetical protein
MIWRSTHYVLTTHRVLIRSGVLRHSGRDIALDRISDVAFVRTLWDRVVNAGTLTIESAGEHGQETLRNVPHSDLVQQSINRLIEQEGDRRAHPYPPGEYPPAQYPGGPGYPTQPGPGYPAPGQYPYPSEPHPGGRPRR